MSEEWTGRQVLVTNNHVVSDEPALPQTLAPEEVTVTFDALHWGAGPEPNFESLPKYEIEQVLWESPILKLDTTVCVLNKRVDGIQDYELAPSMPRTDREDRVYIIGHPKGDELAYSLQNNFLLGLNAERIHYRSPTEPGSSGSPLFNDEWELIGIHHGGGEDMPQLENPGTEYEANEGIPVGAIKSAMRT